MKVSNCRNCGLPTESSNYYFSMNIKCRHCGHSSLPLNAGACFYDKIKTESKPHDPFQGFLSSEFLCSRLAMLFLLSSAISAFSLELRYFTIVAFFGFIMFGSFYGFLRIRNGL
jgi:hypothetical protein